MKDRIAQKIMAETKQNYNTIARRFSNTRSYLPADLLGLRKYIRSDDKLLDLGCGNGRFYEVIRDGSVEYVGVDVSAGLIAESRQRYPEAQFKEINEISLPFADETFDVVVCLAVFHHLPGHQQRQNFLAEIRRVLKPGGRLVLTVWNLWRVPKARKLLLGQAINKLLLKSELDWRDIYFPFKNSAGLSEVDRYLHCFTRPELKSMIKKAGMIVTETDVQARGRKKVNENFLVVAGKN